MKDRIINIIKHWLSQIVLTFLFAILLSIVADNGDYDQNIIILLIIAVIIVKLLTYWLLEKDDLLNSTLQRSVGLIFLIPALLSVYLFTIQLSDNGAETLVNFNYSIGWTGEIWKHDGNGGGAGYQSPLPIYFGLMAIAAAILLKRK